MTKLTMIAVTLQMDRDFTQDWLSCGLTAAQFPCIRRGYATSRHGSAVISLDVPEEDWEQRIKLILSALAGLQFNHSFLFTMDDQRSEAGGRHTVAVDARSGFRVIHRSLSQSSKTEHLLAQFKLCNRQGPGCRRIYGGGEELEEQHTQSLASTRSRICMDCWQGCTAKSSRLPQRFPHGY